ncbi:MAG: hypothetical protein K2I22_13225 [Lachnospiraceae bacterium]|nr:hypothetical protein [Lachnospiraceae bacterium]
MMNIRKEREFAREFYCSGNISLEFHYIDIDDKEWERRIKERNRNVLAGRVNAYYVVDELRMKLNPLLKSLTGVKWIYGYRANFKFVGFSISFPYFSRFCTMPASKYVSFFLVLPSWAN